MISVLALASVLAAAPEAVVPEAPAPVPTEVAPEPAAPAAGEPATEASPEPSATVSEPAEAPATDAPATPAEPPSEGGPTLTGAVERSGPPYYTPADAAALDKRYGIKPATTKPRQARWRCLIADPTCGFSIEVVAMAAWAMRFRQGAVSGEDTSTRWNSGRAQYDVWLDFPILVETEGRHRYTRMTMGPKGGVIASDTGDLWGNVGMATRYWLGRGRWAPAIEFTSALAFKMRGRVKDPNGGYKSGYHMERGPVGFTADVGFSIGGFGAIVVGGQYDSPLAREEVPEPFHTSAGGMVFVGFRGNILWGGPAAAAIVTHGVVQRAVNQP